MPSAPSVPDTQKTVVKMWVALIIEVDYDSEQRRLSCLPAFLESLESSPLCLVAHGAFHGID